MPLVYSKSSSSSPVYLLNATALHNSNGQRPANKHNTSSNGLRVNSTLQLASKALRTEPQNRPSVPHASYSTRSLRKRRPQYGTITMAYGLPQENSPCKVNDIGQSSLRPDSGVTTIDDSARSTPAIGNDQEPGTPPTTPENSPAKQPWQSPLQDRTANTATVARVPANYRKGTTRSGTPNPRSFPHGVHGQKAPDAPGFRVNHGQASKTTSQLPVLGASAQRTRELRPEKRSNPSVGPQRSTHWTREQASEPRPNSSMTRKEPTHWTCAQAPAPRPKQRATRPSPALKQSMPEHPTIEAEICQLTLRNASEDGTPTSYLSSVGRLATDAVQERKLETHHPCRVIQTIRENLRKEKDGETVLIDLQEFTEKGTESQVYVIKDIMLSSKKQHEERLPSGHSPNSLRLI